MKKIIKAEDVKEIMIITDSGMVSTFRRHDDNTFEERGFDPSAECFCEICISEYKKEDSEDGKCPFCHGEGKPNLIKEDDIFDTYDEYEFDDTIKAKIVLNGVCVKNNL